MARLRPLTVSVVTVLGFAAVAGADCVDGVRNPTAGEIAFATRAEAALGAAFPAPIVNSTRNGAHDFSRPPSLSFCKGDPEGAFSSGLAMRYLYTFPKAEAERLYAERKRVEQQIAALEAMPPEKQKEYDQVMTQARAAYQSAPSRKRTDPPFTPEQQAQADRANAEGKRLADAARTIETQYRASVQTQTDPLRAQAKRLESYPQDIRIAFGINLQRLPAAGPLVASFGTASPKRSAGLRVHNVVVAVEGPEGDAAKAFFQSIDVQYLQSLVGTPAPDVEASKARAARVDAAAPVAVPPTRTATAPAVGASPNTAGPATPPVPGAPPANVQATGPAPAAAQAPPTATTGAAAAPEEPAAKTDDPKKGNGAGAAISGATQGVKKLRGLLGR